MTTHDELAIALAAEAPRPRPEFAARLDKRVAAGFPRKRRVPKVPPLAIVGGVTATALAAIVAVTLIGSSDTSVKSSGGVTASGENGAPAAAPGDSGDPRGSGTQPLPHPTPN